MFKLTTDNLSPAHANSSQYTFRDEQGWRDAHWHPQKGDVVFDIGACYGSYALPAAQAGATVYAFEPSLNISKVLQANVDANGFTNQVEVLPIGVLNFDGLHFCDVEGNPHYACPVVRIDSFVKARKLSRIDYIKIDVEDDELLVLEGMRETLVKFKPAVSIEVHAFKGISLGDVTIFLDSVGYTCSDINFYADHPLVWAVFDGAT